MTLLAAANALDDQAAGRQPDRAEVLQGALALTTLAQASVDRDILDAAAGLSTLATGGDLQLDDVGRARAAFLAAKVRAIAKANEN